MINHVENTVRKNSLKYSISINHFDTSSSDYYRYCNIHKTRLSFQFNNESYSDIFGINF